jgi:hypothetical protein
MPKKKKPGEPKRPRGRPRVNPLTVVIQRPYDTIPVEMQGEWTKDEWDALREDTRSLFFNQFAFHTDNQATYTAVLDIDDDDPRFVIVDGCKTYSLVGSNDDDARDVMHRLFGQGNIDSISAVHMKDGTVRDVSIGKPKPPKVEYENPFDDPFYMGETEADE